MNMNANVKKIKLEASSVEDAIRRVASELNVPEACLQAKILSEGKSFLGFFGKKLQLEITVNPDKPVEPKPTATKPAATKPAARAKNAGKESGPDIEREKMDDPDKGKEEEKLKLINESVIFLDELMSKMDVNVRPQVTENFISLEGEDAAIVVGRYGDTLKAIEYILNLCIRETKDLPRIRLDSDGYRERRTINLQRLAFSAAKKAAERGIPIRLEPMASWERRVIHLALQDSPDVATESIGESPERKVVVMPKVNHNEVRARPRRRPRR
jgi:predicted RNA-binding protein Jag